MTDVDLNFLAKQIDRVLTEITAAQADLRKIIALAEDVLQKLDEASRNLESEKA